MSRLPLTGAGPSAGGEYADTVLATAPANLIAYWPLWETSGTTADNYEGTAARDGTFARDVSTMGTATGIGDGYTAPVFDGSNDLVNIYSASLVSAWNGEEGTVFFWMKILDWGTSAYCYSLQEDAGNRVIIYLSAATDKFLYRRAGGGTASDVNYVTAAPTTWVSTAITWSEAEDEMKAYYNGSQVGTTQSSLGSWAGDPLTANEVCIGAQTATPAGNIAIHGAHFAIWTTPLTSTQIATLATV